MTTSTHLILISAQSVPNLTPLLDNHTTPQRVVMLVSPDMRERADWLEAVIKPRGIQTQRWPISNAYDIEHIQNRVLELLDTYPDGDITLNATGGTKPMSIAAYEVFRTFEKPIFYVHPDHDRLIWMYPNGRPAHDLANRIKLKEFLQSYGATVTNLNHQGVHHDLRELGRKLASQVQTWATPLTLLNAYAAAAKPTLSVEVRPEHLNYPALEALIDLFRVCQCLAWQGKRLVFNDEAARFFVNGGWLEDYVYSLCLNLKAAHGIQDIARSIEVERNPSIRNEMDVALLKENRLYVIECKTHNDKGQTDGKNTGAIYKLDSQKDLLGGLQAKGMLVSFNRLNDYDRQRAHDLRITVCDHDGLAQLPEKLATWLNR